MTIWQQILSILAVGTPSPVTRKVIALKLQTDTGTNPSLPAYAAPGSQTAPAPQTAGKMKSWNPDDVAEAQAQKQRQYESDMQAIRDAAKADSSNADPGDPPDDATDETLGVWLLTAIAVGAVAAVSLMSRKGGR